MSTAGSVREQPMRTQDEIVNRIRTEKANGNDWIGTVSNTLAPYLDAAHVKLLCKTDADLSDWKQQEYTCESVLTEMQKYMEFACEKASGHRGISAARSIEHYRSWTWLLGDESKIDWTKYKNYGTPILRQICELYRFAWIPGYCLGPMSEGEPCADGCEEGCG